MLSKEKRIELRNELFDEYEKLSYKTFIISKFKIMINNNEELKKNMIYTDDNLEMRMNQYTV